MVPGGTAPTLSGVADILFAGTMYMSNGSAFIFSDGGSMSYLPTAANRTNGLCGSESPGSLWFTTASFDGEVRWRVLLADGPGHAADWEEIVEGSFEPAAPPVHLVDMDLATSHALDLPIGRYRFWYCGRGLDGDRAGAYERMEVQPDEYEVRFWPSDEMTPFRVVKTTTQAAAYWHGAATRC